MKKTYVLTLLMVFSAACFAQEADSVQARAREDLLRKSKNQKTTGFILLGTGAVAVAGGAISNSIESGVTLIVAGGLSMLGGVFFLVASGNNKEKANAMTASFKMEKGVPPMLRDMGPTYYPALSLKFNIR